MRSILLLLALFFGAVAASANDNHPLAILCIVVFFMLVLSIGYFGERRSWNGGKCSCGGYWKRFDNDSQGGRGYKCVACDTRVWISYPVDRKYVEGA
jgi:hypothetical protein